MKMPVLKWILLTLLASIVSVMAYFEHEVIFLAVIIWICNFFIIMRDIERKEFEKEINKKVENQ